MSSSTPDFSIIITSATGDIPERTIRSARLQSLYKPDFEIIEMRERPGTHLHAMRNEGIAVARGRYLIFLDAGDFLRCDTLEILTSFLRNKSPDLVYLDVKTLNSLGDPKPQYRERGQGKGMDGVRAALSAEWPYAAFPGGVVYSRSFLLGNDLRFTANTRDDLYFSIACALAASQTASWLEEPLYYRVEDEVDVQTTDEYFTDCEGVYRLLEQHNAVEKYRIPWREGVLRRGVYASLYGEGTAHEIKEKVSTSELFLREGITDDLLLMIRSNSSFLKWPPDNYDAICEAAAGAVVMIGCNNVMIRNLEPIARQLKRVGIKCVILDWSDGVQKGLRAPTPEERMDYAGIPYFVFDISSMYPLFLNARAYILPCSPFFPIDRLIVHLRERQIPTISLTVSAVDILTDGFGKRLFWNTDAVMVPGEHFLPFAEGRDFIITGLPFVDKLWEQPSYCPEKPWALINYLDDAEYLEMAVQACAAIGLPYVMSLPPGIPPKPPYESGFSQNTIYQDLRDCTVLISYESSCVAESIALGKPVVCYKLAGKPGRYHWIDEERYAGYFEDSNGTVRIVGSKEAMIHALNDVLEERKSPSQIRTLGSAWLSRRTNVPGERSPAVYAAEAVQEILEKAEPAFQRRIMHLAGHNPANHIPLRWSMPECRRTLKRAGIMPMSELFPPVYRVYLDAPVREMVSDPADAPLVSVSACDPHPAPDEDQSLEQNVRMLLDAYNMDAALECLDEYQMRYGRDAKSISVEDVIKPYLEKSIPGCSYYPPAGLTDHVATLAHLKDCFQGQRAFILGSGLSTRMLDTGLLKDEVTFVGGRFSPASFGVNPTFYFVMGGRAEHLLEKNNNGGFKIFPDTIRIVPYSTRHYPGDDKGIVSVNVIPFQFSSPLFSTDASIRLWQGIGVAYYNLQLAYYLGFSRVYLLGFENTFEQDIDMKGIEKGYVKARRAYQLGGREIYNATPGGLLHVFDRIGYHEIFESGGPAVLEDRLGIDYLADLWKGRYGQDQRGCT